MQFDLDIGGRVRSVRVTARGGRLEVSVDDRVFEVDARPVGRETLSLLVREGGGAVRSVDATVTPSGRGAGFAVALDGQLLTAAIVPRFGGRRGEAVRGAGPQLLTSPMPGKVVRVLVAAGAEVQPRQGLVVIEAMKMENELRASGAGQVTAIHVVEGQSVEAGALLVTVE